MITVDGDFAPQYPRLFQLSHKERRQPWELWYGGHSKLLTKYTEMPKKAIFHGLQSSITYLETPHAPIPLRYLSYLALSSLFAIESIRLCQVIPGGQVEGAVGNYQ